MHVIMGRFIMRRFTASPAEWVWRSEKRFPVSVFYDRAKPPARRCGPPLFSPDPPDPRAGRWAAPTLMTKPMTSAWVLTTRFTFTYVLAVGMGRGSVCAFEWQSTLCAGGIFCKQSDFGGENGGQMSADNKSI